MKDEALRLAAEHDTFAAIAWLAAHEDAVATAKAFSEVFLHLYWQEKNLPKALAFGRAGVQFSLAAATSCSAADGSEANELRGLAKAMSYNLASFTWPGWDEPGIVITSSDVALGLDAAKANLRFALELQKGDLPLSRGHWMLGAQQLASRQFAAAHSSFTHAVQFAAAANNLAEALLARGFAAIVNVVANAAEPDACTQATNDLDAIRAQLRQLPDGEAFCEQFASALRVFAPRA